MTRKQAHAEAVAMLDQIAEIADQAHSLLRSARTDLAVETGSGVRRIAAHQLTDSLASLARSAREATCDDCYEPIADCACLWANQDI